MRDRAPATPPPARSSAGPASVLCAYDSAGALPTNAALSTTFQLLGTRATTSIHPISEWTRDIRDRLHLALHTLSALSPSRRNSLSSRVLLGPPSHSVFRYLGIQTSRSLADETSAETRVASSALADLDALALATRTRARSAIRLGLPSAPCRSYPALLTLDLFDPDLARLACALGSSRSCQAPNTTGTNMRAVPPDARARPRTQSGAYETVFWGLGSGQRRSRGERTCPLGWAPSADSIPSAHDPPAIGLTGYRPQTVASSRPRLATGSHLSNRARSRAAHGLVSSRITRDSYADDFQPRAEYPRAGANQHPVPSLVGG
ncbi:hypothetical protein AcV5_005182 [Taiwanofungus camphoratus]|nr:hypothetical protein AcV5_005182 [Antrodia cinnamomea]